MKSEMWLAIFWIMSWRISLFQMASGVSNSPRKVSLNFSAPTHQQQAQVGVALWVWSHHGSPGSTPWPLAAAAQGYSAA